MLSLFTKCAIFFLLLDVMLFSGNVRYFCGECGCHLFAYNREYAKYVYPLASAIDTPLPKPKPEDIYRLMLNKDSKCNWAITPDADDKHNFEYYPDTSLEDWHKAHNQFITK
jgi:hypothetical protein